ncbi:MAG TPA: hypothetical protein VGE07_21660 [Herpetosiphonaceae bacterium]
MAAIVSHMQISLSMYRVITDDGQRFVIERHELSWRWRHAGDLMGVRETRGGFRSWEVCMADLSEHLQATKVTQRIFGHSRE